MKTLKTIVATLALLTLQAANAQTPLTSPGAVAWTADEHFEGRAFSWAYSFPGFGGTATVQRLGGGWPYFSANNYSGSKSLVGDQTDIAITFASKKQAFGGYFERADGTGAYVSFYRAGVKVGLTQFVSLSSTAWSWKGWDLSSLGGFDTVFICGNGGFRGGIYMDALRVK